MDCGEIRSTLVCTPKTPSSDRAKRNAAARLDPEANALVETESAELDCGFRTTPFRIEKRDRSQRWQGERYSHELYMMGHLIEAGVAHHQATGKRSLLDVGIKSANLMLREFGPDKLRIPPGHQEIELALVRLYRVTGEWKYVELARFFLEQRGRPEGHKLFDLHNQDLTPVAEQTKAEGHCVRAAYQYTAMTDVVALMGDARYRPAVEAIWSDLVGGKMFVTGGVGLRGFQPNMGLGLEQFTPPYVLPEERADVDTCSVIGLVFWLHRMNLLKPDGRYGDLIERMLFNRILAGVSLDGTRFSYGLPLIARSPHANDNDQHDVLGAYSQDHAHFRKPWMGCACCPPNLARLLPTIGQYAYAQDEKNLYVNQFIDGEATAELGGAKVGLTVRGVYPWGSRITFVAHPEKPAEFALKIRIPGWARNEAFPSDLYRFASPSSESPSLRLNGQTPPLVIDRGFATLTRTWQKGDTIELDLPMPVRRVVAHAKVGNLAGKITLQRGPLLYCLEGADHGGHVLNLRLPREAVLTPLCLGQPPAGRVHRLGARAAVVTMAKLSSASTKAVALAPEVVVPSVPWRPVNLPSLV